MAKKTVTTTEEIDVSKPAEVPAEAPKVVSRDDDDALQVLRELAGDTDDVRWEVKRTLPSEKRGYCKTYASTELTMDALQSELGPGHYQIRGRRSDGTYTRTQTVIIAVDVRPREIAAAPAPVVIQQSDGVPPMVQMMLDMQARMIEALTKRPEPVAQPAQPTLLEIIATLTPLLKADKGGGSDSVEVLLKGINLGKDIGGGGGGETGIMDLAGKALGLLPELAKMQGERGAAAPLPTIPSRPVNPTQPTPAAPAQPKPETTPMMKTLLWVRAQLQMLVSQAARNKDPGLYADLFLDNLPEYFSVADVKERFADPTGIDALGKLNADVLKHRDWFERFREIVLERIAEHEASSKPPVPDSPDGHGGDSTIIDGEVL